MAELQVSKFGGRLKEARETTYYMDGLDNPTESGPLWGRADPVLIKKYTKVWGGMKLQVAAANGPIATTTPATCSYSNPVTSAGQRRREWIPKPPQWVPACGPAW